MKRSVAAVLISMALLGTITGCGGHADIGKEKATEIALNDASLTESDVTRLHVSKDSDDGQRIYEVSFTSGATEYEYEILASNGEIHSVDYDGPGPQNQNGQTNQTDQNGQQNLTDQNGQQNPAGQNGQQNQTGQNGQQQTDQHGGQTHGHSGSSQNAQADVQISAEEASQLALDRVPGAAAQDLKIELDYDDGYYKYEGDIIYDQKEYEFEIDANTGEFLEWK